MADIVVFASGNGSNFEAIVDSFTDSQHSVCCLIYDRRSAYVRERAARRGIRAHYVRYFQRQRDDAESDIRAILSRYSFRFIVLAGFMRVLSESFVNAYPQRIVNIHPALLPLHPGARGLIESYHSDDDRLGVTVHYIDAGIDTGPIIAQESFDRDKNESLEAIETRIHGLEHVVYPTIIRSLLDSKAIAPEVHQ